MAKLITAFFMAWGNFITLPCPYKKWDDKLKNLMLAMLPSVGLVVGAIFLLLSLGMRKLGVPSIITAFILEFYLFYIHGFMHLDGFMDCTDAVMSRRPLEERQRIMKDPNVGSFAVVMTIFIILGTFAGLYKAISADVTAVFAMAAIPIFSRGLAGRDVLMFKPIGHSQYVDDHKQKNRKKCVAAAVAQMVLYCLAILLIIWRFYGDHDRAIEMLLLTLLATEFGQALSAMYARRQLGGMSGDIAGYSIVWGEFTGIMCCALLTEYLPA